MNFNPNCILRGSGCVAFTLLEDKLRPQLQNTGVVGGNRRQECGGRAIVRAVTGGVVDGAPLRMVEDVECLRAKLEVHFFVDGEVLEEAHIVICPMRQGENVATGVAIRKPLWSGEGIAVEESWSLHSGGMPDGRRTVNRPYDVGVGLDGSRKARDQTLAIVADRVSSARIISILSIHYAERHP